jgi:hypothetical protein
MLPIYALAAIVLGAELGGWTRLRGLGLGGWVPMLGLVIAIAVAGMLSRDQRAALVAQLRSSPVARAGAALIAAAVLSAANAERPDLAFGFAAQIAGVVALYFACLSVDREQLARALALVAAASIGLHAMLLLCGPGLFGVLAPNPWPFQAGAHQHAGGLPRFYGFGVNPFYCALLMLASLGLLEGLPHARLRRALRLIAIAIIASTLSFIALLLPILLSGFIRRDWLRRTFIAAVVLAALTALYVHPLELRVGSNALALGELRPGYLANGDGPKHMPVHEVDIGDARLSFHATAYVYLAQNAVGCFLEHPLVGTGGENTAVTCPVRVMNTYGTWSSSQSPHHAYLGLLADLGVLGLIALGWMARSILGRLERPIDPWLRSIFTVYLLAGLASPILFRVPFAALLALRARVIER